MSCPAQLVIGPNASLTGRQAGWVMAGVGAVGLGIALVWAALGFWPVLPFAGLELAAFGAALFLSVRGNRYREVLTFGESVLRVEFGTIGRGPQSLVELPRAWVRVDWAAGSHRNEPSQLWLGSSGQRVRIGRCLTDEERTRLARRIRELLSAAAPGPAVNAVRTDGPPRRI